MKTLDRYLAKTVIMGTLTAIAVLTVLSGFMTFVSQLHNIGIGHYTISTAVIYTASTMPEWASDIFPAATLIGTLMALGALAQGNELMVLRATGVSTARLVRSLLFGGVILLVMFAILAEYIAPPTKRYAESERALALYHEAALLGPFGLWARDGNLVVNVARLGQHRSFDGIHVFRFRRPPHQGLSAVGYAARADFKDRRWVLEDLDETRFDKQKLSLHHAFHAHWPQLLSPDLFKVLVVDPSNLSAFGLWEYIGYLHRNHLSAEQYEVAFWKKIADFCSIPLMIIFSLPFLFGSIRNHRFGFRLFIGVVAGLLYYFLGNVIANMGDAFHLEPILIAFAPLSAFIIVTSVLIYRTY
ncbi:MAG: LPS export ABC transporter permease LptG [Gammaproteobacteria bacterium]